MKPLSEIEELKAQIAYIEKYVRKCRNECKPYFDIKEKGEWLGYSTCLNIIQNSKDKDRRKNDGEP